MYIVKCDGVMLYHPDVDELRIFNAKMKFEANKSGGFDFTIFPSHPRFEFIYKLKSVIEVFQDSTLLFRGRILNDEQGFDNEKRIECEGDLGLLNDSIVRPYEYNGSITGFLTMLLSSHNAQVEAGKEFQLGTVTVTDPNDYIIRSSINAEKTWKVFTDKLLNMLGGYVRIRRVGGVNYLDYLEDSTNQSLQALKLGENILDVTRKTSGDEIITALIPYGVKLKDEDGKETANRLSIQSVNSGVDYVFDQTAVDAYGWVFDTKTWDDVTDANNLKNKAIAELNARLNLNVEVNIKAVDLSMVDAEIDEFRILEYVKIESTPHELNAFMLVTKLEVDILNATNNKMTVGMSYSSFTDEQIGLERDLNNLTQTIEIGKSQTNNEIIDTIVSLESSIAQTDRDIRMNVSETYTSKSALDEYKLEVSSQFTQTAESFTFDFETLEQVMKDLDGETSAEFANIRKFIQFVNGDIILGEAGNPLQLKIENDRIAFIFNGLEGAYWANGNFYITDVRVLTSIRIGNYAFIPRTNGNLSFKWVG